MQNHDTRKSVRFHLVGVFSSVAVLLLLAACAVKLAPDPSESILKDLDGINKQVEALFTKTVPDDKPASKTDFDKAKPAYDDLLVSLKALKRKLEARPMPQSPFASIFHDEADANPKDIEKFLQAPTIGSVANLIKQTEKMRELQQSSGLTATEVKGFHGFMNNFLKDALTYENWLKR
ncbi:MAG: hypothetical protein ISR48_03450 [Alphaproteobacteria bacterium]|nr:hypothetical protein [Alphaproteobacteria bacterium]